MHYMRMVLHVLVYLDNTEDMDGPNNDQFLLTSPTKYRSCFMYMLAHGNIKRESVMEVTTPGPTA